MDAKLKELIETIRAEGVKTAEETARKIVGDAEKKAAEIVATAKADAALRISQAQDEADRKTMSGNEALKQAGRDLILNVEKQLERVFSSVIQKETKAALASNVLEECVVSMVKNWKGGSSGELGVLLTPEDLKRLETSLASKLAAEMKKGLEIKASPALKSGFRIGEKDGSAYFDFSGDSIAEALSSYLNPKLSALIREAAGKEKA